MANKSAAQVRRNEKRAQSRGETYQPPTPTPPTTEQQQQQQQQQQQTTSDTTKLLIINNNNNTPKNNKNKTKKEKRTIELTKAKAAIKYHTTLTTIESNTELKAKERRSAKRRVEAIACEEGGVEDITELLEWFEELKGVDDHVKMLAETAASGEKKNKKKRKNEEDGEGGGDGDGGGDGEGGTKRVNPYILFIGQIPFDTTSDDIFKHFQQFMGKKVITTENIKIRIPAPDKKSNDNDKTKEKVQQPDAITTITITATTTIIADEKEDELNTKPKTITEIDPKPKKPKTNKGYAFCEFLDPELMYECLKLHHTSLSGRRINVIRAAGGGKKARVETQKIRQKEQDDYVSTTVDKITQGYIDSGDLKVGELDAGAILLCKRRSAATVEDAIKEYVKERGEQELENPSSYFTRIICRVTEEGVDAGAGGAGRRGGRGGSNSGRGGRGDGRGRGRGGGRGRGRGRGDGERQTGISRKENASSMVNSSLLSRAGVDMQMGSSNDVVDGSQPEQNSLSKIFPSMMRRGRGRGRGGYM